MFNFKISNKRVSLLDFFFLVVVIVIIFCEGKGLEGSLEKKNF